MTKDTICPTCEGSKGRQTCCWVKCSTCKGIGRVETPHVPNGTGAPEHVRLERQMEHVEGSPTTQAPTDDEEPSLSKFLQDPELQVYRIVSTHVNPACYSNKMCEECRWKVAGLLAWRQSGIDKAQATSTRQALEARIDELIVTRRIVEVWPNQSPAEYMTTRINALQSELDQLTGEKE